MKRVLSALFTLLMGVSASATVYDTNYYPGNNGVDDAALRVCESMSSFNRNDCLQAIIGKRFSQAGLKVCASVSVYSESTKISCLNAIANKAFQSDTAQVCQTISDFNKLDCLKAVENRRFIPAAVNTCKAMSIYSESTKIECLKSIAERTFSQEALNFCAPISDFNKLECLKTASGNYFQDIALNVCSRISIYNESGKLKCMSLVKNKYYDSRLLNFCASSAEYQLNSCIAGLQATALNLPGFNGNRQRTDLDIVLDTLDYILNGNVQSQRQPEVIIIERERPVVVQRPVIVQKPAVNTCLAREQEGKVKSQTVATADFYQLAKNTAIETGKCVIARMANTDRSSMLFDANGTQRIKNASYREIDTLKRESSDLKGKGCYQFICDDAK